MELLPILALLRCALWWKKVATQHIQGIERVCQSALRGDMDARVVGRREPVLMGNLGGAVNNMLDVVDAFVREASASMEYVSKGRMFRKVLTRGLRGIQQWRGHAE